MSHYIALTNEAGHVVMTPLWKLPQLVAAEVETKKEVIAQVKAQQAAAEEAQRQAEDAQRQAAIAETAGLDSPFDLTQDTGF
jgi:hypothetical protein